jgi:protein-tyrosine phosphatase
MDFNGRECPSTSSLCCGNRRTGTLLAAYLVTQGENPEKAIALVQKARPTAELRDVQKQFLQELAHNYKSI